MSTYNVYNIFQLQWLLFENVILEKGLGPKDKDYVWCDENYHKNTDVAFTNNCKLMKRK